uniref:non-specific protein-tyrosine kinase n=1 Tax=Steinernema glaseri TaxID=37863 RepID=A0A1I8AMG2_9BILA
MTILKNYQPSSPIFIFIFTTKIITLEFCANITTWKKNKANKAEKPDPQLSSPQRVVEVRRASPEASPRVSDRCGMFVRLASRLLTSPPRACSVPSRPCLAGLRMESSSGGDVLIEEALLDVLRETELLCYHKKLYVGLQLSRIEHFDHATDDDLIQLGGLAPPSVRRLREALERKKKAFAKKKSSIFANGKPLPGTNMVPVPKKDAGWSEGPEPSTAELPGSSSTSLIKPEEIKLMERLGEGTFATVKRAIWNAGPRKVDVAVKILKDVSADVMEDLLLEVSNMQKLQHPNLIKLYGIVFARPTMMVTELCEGGALLDRLRAQNKPLVLMATLVDYAQQIARGMTYLESKHCVHRDLATRNVLLTDNDKTIKICDFGLMRCLDDTERLYVMSAPKKVPFSWCPPESLRYRQFSHASDVWAFGVTLWELFTYGEEPWVGYRAADVLKMTESGDRLRKPARASKELDSIMRMCWELKPENRPKFSLLSQLLKEIHFDTAECITVNLVVNDGDLALNPRDKVIVVDSSHATTWFGQNVTSKLYGRFPKSAVTMRSRQVERPPREERISRPVKGSFVHTGHGDVRGGMCWGHPDKIDDIYLKNPVLKPLNE